jgi:ADP-ribosylglycohydrolase
MGEPDDAINNSKGCGGVMRVAPVGLTASDPFLLGEQTAAITHGHPTGSVAAGALAQIIQHILGGHGLANAIEETLPLLALHEWHDETYAAMMQATDLARSTPPSPEAVESLGAGWIAEEALAISLYCALTASDMRSALLLAVNHGGDSDSTGAIVGNLLGALWGEEAIPPEWLEALELRDVIARVADDLHSMTEGAEIDTDRYPPF